MASIANTLLRPLGFELKRKGGRKRLPSPSVSLQPQIPTKGRALLSYVLDPFQLDDRSQASKDHTHHWESLCIADTFLDRGIAVDVIHYNDSRYTPDGHYDFLISARTNLARLAQSLNDDCIKVAHLDTAHWLRNNTNAMQRLLDLQQRRGITLSDAKLVEENTAVEHADFATVLGNGFTLQSYEFAKTPLHRTRISVPATYDFPTAKNYAKASKEYIWFGSSGFVHKGLDLVIEAFADMPDFQLHICGPLDQEPEFMAAYAPLLAETPNIHAIGWVDVDGEAFKSLCNRCLGIVYPSCAEGGGGSVISCQHAGLLPIVSAEASVDIHHFGIELADSSIATIQATLRHLASKPATELEQLARESWESVRKYHSRQRFAEEYAGFVSSKLNL